MTPVGREFYEAARAVVHSVALLRDIAMKAQKERSLVLRAAGSRIACDILVGDVVARFLRGHPEIQFTSYSINQRDVPILLSTGDVDFLLVEQEPKKGGPFRFRPLLTDHIGLVLPLDNPLARKSPIQASDLLGLKFALPPPGHRTRSLIEDRLGLIVARLNVIAETDSSAAILECVESGLCAGFVSKHMLVDAKARNSIAVRDIEGIDLSRMFGIITDPERVATPALECFLRWVDGEQSSVSGS